MGFKAQMEELALHRRDIPFTETNEEREERIAQMNKIVGFRG